MVVKITMPRFAQRVLNYNEQKVKKGKAVCIGGEHFLGEAATLNLLQKASVFQRRLELNDRASTRMIHISLNFDPTESLNNEKLLRIASDYMQKIGFGEQPYFVYRHHDTHHPHIHIVSTIIRSDGSRISTHNLGRNQSSEARKEIEENYNLVSAESASKKRGSHQQPANAQKAEYGKGETGETINGVVQSVAASFNYTSLAEFNAALRLYNVTADTGIERNGIGSHKALRYYILDNQGRKIGAGIKASSLPGKPVAAWLEKCYEENKSRRQALRNLLKQTIDSALLRQPYDFGMFEQQLSHLAVTVLLRTNEEGKHYGITFIDTQNRSVFNGSELGKEYSIASLQKTIPFAAMPKETEGLQSTSQNAKGNRPKAIVKRPNVSDLNKGVGTSVLKDLLTPETNDEHIPAQLMRKKEKRKKKRKQS